MLTKRGLRVVSPGRSLMQCFLLWFKMHPLISCMQLETKTFENSAASVLYKDPHMLYDFAQTDYVQTKLNQKESFKSR